MFNWTPITAILCLSWFVVPLHAVPLPKQREPEPGEAVEVEIAKGMKMKFCWIPAGKATLGSPATEKGRRDNENVHEFNTKGFWLGKYAVTQEQWEAVMGNNPSFFSKQDRGVQGLDTSRFPVENVSWDDCQDFLKKLNERVKIPNELGKGIFSLPHEDEWEYACRGGKGNKQPFYFGSELNGTQANCNGEKPYGTTTKGIRLGRTTTVGSYEKIAPHPWGLCDMIGNVDQWCEDKLGVHRGSSWCDLASSCRTANRGSIAPGPFGSHIGFRVGVLP